MTVQADVGGGRAQAVGAPVPPDSGLQEPSEGPGCEGGHQAGLHGRWSELGFRGEDPSREQSVAVFAFFLIYFTFLSILLLNFMANFFFYY